MLLLPFTYNEIYYIKQTQIQIDHNLLRDIKTGSVVSGTYFIGVVCWYRQKPNIAKYACLITVFCCTLLSCFIAHLEYRREE